MKIVFLTIRLNCWMNGWKTFTLIESNTNQNISQNTIIISPNKDRIGHLIYTIKCFLMDHSYLIGIAETAMIIKFCLIAVVFYPIIPMVLINGAEGIGMGWKTSVPCHNPRDIVKVLNLFVKIILHSCHFSKITGRPMKILKGNLQKKARKRKLIMKFASYFS